MAKSSKLYSTLQAFFLNTFVSRMPWLTVILLAIALVNQGQGKEQEVEQGQDQEQEQGEQGQGQDLSGCCTYLRVDTEGLAREHQGNRMGLYRSVWMGL